MDKSVEEEKVFQPFEHLRNHWDLPKVIPAENGYLLKFWGGVTQLPEFKKIHGERSPAGGGYNRWFNTAQERAIFKAELFVLTDTLGSRGLAISEEEGDKIHLRTVAVATFREQDGKEYVIEDDFGYGYPAGTVVFDFRENNRSCCHRRRNMIMEQHPDCGLEEIECCDAEPPIVITKFAIEFRE